MKATGREGNLVSGLSKALKKCLVRRDRSVWGSSIATLSLYSDLGNSDN